MTPAAFKTKWAKFSGKESAAYAEHFNDLCRMLGVPTPVEADPTGSDTFCFQKHVAMDGGLFDFDTTGPGAPGDRRAARNTARARAIRRLHAPVAQSG